MLRSRAICWELHRHGAGGAGLRSDLRGISNFSTALLVIDLIVIFSPKIPGLSYTGGLGMTGWIKIPGIGLTFQPVGACQAHHHLLYCYAWLAV